MNESTTQRSKTSETIFNFWLRPVLISQAFFYWVAVLGLYLFIIYISMESAPDRANYLVYFNNPSRASRLELGFQKYLEIIYVSRMPAEFGLLLSFGLMFSLAIYVWKNFLARRSALSVLIFIFIFFGPLSYYSGISLRMGMAMVLCGIAALSYFYKRHLAWPACLALALSIHWGVLLFVIGFVVCLFRFKHYVVVHSLISLASGLILYALMKSSLLGHISSGYYFSVISDFGSPRADGRIPFTYMFQLSLIIFLLLNYRKLFQLPKIFLGMFIYSIPFSMLAIYGYTVFAKLTAPFLLLNLLAMGQIVHASYDSSRIKNLYYLAFSTGSVMSLSYSLLRYGIF